MKRLFSLIIATKQINKKKLLSAEFTLLYKFNNYIQTPYRNYTTNNNNNKMSELIEVGKKSAGYQAIDDNITSNTKVIGIGSGSTILYAIERLAQRVKNESLNVLCVPSSFQSRQAILKYGLNLTDLETHTTIDVTIDGADDVDRELNCIKGGGGCHLQEKLIASCAKTFILIADTRKMSEKLGDNWSNGVPIEVLPAAYRLVKEKIEAKYGGEAVLRQAKAKAGPVVTDNGNFILDWKFDRKKLPIKSDGKNIDWKTVNIEISMIPGLIETGLFIGMAKIAYFGNTEGGVVTRTVD